MSCRIVTLISGSGSNLQAFIDAEQKNQLGGAKLVGVISNRLGAGGLARAKQAHIPTSVVGHQSFANRHEYEQALLAQIAQWSPNLIVLAGFMRVLSSTLITPWLGRILNIHPSLLPAYPGLNTHARVLAAGNAYHGASVHFVTETLDGGPVVAYGQVPILTKDTTEKLAARVLAVEHQIYPKTVALFAQGRLAYIQGRARYDGQLLPTRGLCWNEGELD